LFPVESFLAASFLALTLAASFLYYRRIKQARGEYEGAKDLVKSITLGFSTRLSKLSKSVERIEEEAKYIRHETGEALKAGSVALKAAREGLMETRKLAHRIEETERAVESVKTAVHKLERGYRPLNAQKAVESPIPLQQDAVLEQLTRTEVEVLVIIEDLGEGSVPEIRERIKKTREHTARLLKKLYERGFIDRNTSSMPYRYYIRKEIREIIQQQKKRMKMAV